jgi:hypothetical protein
MAHMRAPSPSAKLPSLRCTVSVPNLSLCTYMHALLSPNGTQQMPLCAHLEEPWVISCRLSYLARPGGGGGR